MRFLKRIISLIGLSSITFATTAYADEYAVGQVWSYKTRAGEENSRLIIVQITPMPNSEKAYSIFLEGVKIKNPHIDGKIQKELSHAPCSKETLDKSIKKLIETRTSLPDYKEGYQEWKKAFDSGEAGVFTVSVAEIISFIEKAVEQPNK